MTLKPKWTVELVGEYERRLRNDALERKAENARELGLDYEPQRTWVGLTDEDLQPIADEYRILFGSWVVDFARTIEAKLKEKNT